MVTFWRQRSQNRRGPRPALAGEPFPDRRHSAFHMVLGRLDPPTNLNESGFPFPVV